jgi:hypothetical protein
MAVARQSRIKALTGEIPGTGGEAREDQPASVDIVVQV